jgi:2-polyprenyl-6-methoxyphenol hydroxylase-like FAD-dependent oxidoreductase
MRRDHSLQSALHRIRPEDRRDPMRNEETGEETTREPTEVVIGCDGSASAIRAEMLKLSRFNFSQQYLDYGYKELTIPAGPQGRTFAGDSRAAHLAAGQSHADCVAQHRWHVRLHSVSAV